MQMQLQCDANGQIAVNDLIAAVNGKEEAHYRAADNPTTSVNPESPGAVWINTATGDVFVCTDNTKDANRWVGTNGTAVPYVTVIDILGDGSRKSLWPLDGNTIDLGGVAPGKWVGNAQYNQGSIGQAAVFDGSSKIDISAIKALPESKVFSFSLFYQDSGSSGTYALVNAQSATHVDGNFILRMNGTKVEFIMTTSYGYAVLSSFSSNLDGKWHFLAAGINAVSGDYFFCSNSRVDRGLLDNLKFSDLDTAWIGANKNSDLFAGKIDHVSFFQKLLTDDDLEKLRNEGVWYDFQSTR